jgi:hypothetical protein
MKLPEFKHIDARFIAAILIFVFFFTGHFGWRLSLVLLLLSCKVRLQLVADKTNSGAKGD